MAASAQVDPDKRKRGGHDEETGLPVILMDYGLFEEKVTVITVKDLLTGATLAYECETKGPGDTWVIRQLARDIDD